MKVAKVINIKELYVKSITMKIRTDGKNLCSFVSLAFAAGDLQRYVASIQKQSAI